MRKLPFVLALVGLAAAAFATEGDDALRRAVRALVSGDDAGRSAAVQELQSQPAEAVPLLVELVRELNTHANRATFAGEEIGLVDEPAAAGPTLRLYDVRDLLSGERDLAAVIARLREIAPEAERLEQAGEGVITVVGGRDVHGGVEGLLDQMRMDLAPQIMLEFRIAQAADPTVLDLAAAALPGDVVDADDPDARFAEWVERGVVEVVTAPQIIAILGQRATVSVGRQISYVKDFDVEISNAAQIGDPLIDTVFAGTSIETTATSRDDGALIDLDTTVAASSVREPMSRVATTLAGRAETVEIQFPETTRTEVRRRLTVESGRAVLLVLPPLDGKTRVALVKATHLLDGR